MKLLIAILLATALNAQVAKRFPLRQVSSGGGGGSVPDAAALSYTYDFPQERLVTPRIAPDSPTPGQCYQNQYDSGTEDGNITCYVTPIGYSHRYTEPAPANPPENWLLVDGDGVNVASGLYLIHMGTKSGLTLPVSAPIAMTGSPVDYTEGTVSGPLHWHPVDPAANDALTNRLNYRLYAFVSHYIWYTPVSGWTTSNLHALYKYECNSVSVATCATPAATWAWSLVKNMGPLIDWTNDAFCTANCDPGNPARSYAGQLCGSFASCGSVPDRRPYMSITLQQISNDGNRFAFSLRNYSKSEHANFLWIPGTISGVPGLPDCAGDCFFGYYPEVKQRVTSSPAMPSDLRFAGLYFMPYSLSMQGIQFNEPSPDVGDGTVFVPGINVGVYRSSWVPVSGNKFGPCLGCASGVIEGVTPDGFIAHGANTFNGQIHVARDLNTGGAAGDGTWGTRIDGSPNSVGPFYVIDNLSTTARISESAGMYRKMPFFIDSRNGRGGTHISAPRYATNWAFASLYPTYNSYLPPAIPWGTSISNELVAINLTKDHTLPSYPAPLNPPDGSFVRLGQLNTCEGYISGGVMYGCLASGYGSQPQASASMSGKSVYYRSANRSPREPGFTTVAYPSAEATALTSYPRVMRMYVPNIITSTYTAP